MDERILRARARANLRNNWGVSIAVAVVAVLKVMPIIRAYKM